MLAIKGTLNSWSTKRHDASVAVPASRRERAFNFSELSKCCWRPRPTTMGVSAMDPQNERTKEKFD